MSDSNSVKIAEEAVSYYIGASFDREFSYDCNVNPENLSDAVLSQRLDDARAEMINALAALDDTEAAGVLQRVQQRDHDNSLFAVVMLDDVREHRAANMTGSSGDEPDRPSPLKRRGLRPEP